MTEVPAPARTVPLPLRRNMVPQGPGEGARCAYCDSRYCWDGCATGVAGFAYVVGSGYYAEADITTDMAPLVLCQVCGGTRTQHIGDCGMVGK